VVISNRALSPKLLEQLPGTLDGLTQMELQKEEMAVQLAAAGSACCLFFGAGTLMASLVGVVL